MRRNVLAALLLAMGFICGPSYLLRAQSTPAAKPFSWPLQVEMRVPFAPSAVPSGRSVYLFYELYLTNFGSAPITLSQLQVLDSSSSATAPIAVFEARQLQTMLQPIGRSSLNPEARLRLNGGESAIVFIAALIDRNAAVPPQIKHRVVTTESTLDGATVETHHVALHLLTSPVHGSGWTAADGPGNSEDNHHRRGTLILNGSAIDSRRFAIDWKRMKDGVSFSGDRRDVRSYFCYGQPVFAVADGRVINAKDGLPENVPGHGEEFHPAVPLDFSTIAGNTITIDLGDGQFAYYMHLQPGSVHVKAGDRVKKGQLLANIGASGDAREPHLHFEVTSSPTLLLGEGLPYLLEDYRSTSGSDGAMQNHHRELPLNGEVVDFQK